MRCTDRFHKQTKEMCGRRSHEEAAALGYPSTAALARALNVWATCHRWSLRTIVEASAHTAQGVDYHLENQRAMVFVVAPRELDPHNPHSPADAFILDQGRMVSKDERSFLAAK